MTKKGSMKVKIQQFLFGKSHSWSVTGKAIGRELIKRGHEVHFISTDGIKKEFVDLDLYDHIRKDKFMPVSKWHYEACLENKIPGEKLALFPHGVDVNLFINSQPMQLKTDKKIKILINITQLHIRKNLSGTLNAIGESLNKNDDVCLVLKIAEKKPEYPFELSFNEIFKEFNKKYPNHVECLIIKDYIPNIESLYKACDILFLLSHAEAYSLTHAEGLISKMIVFSSKFGGAMDYLTEDNSFLINGKLIRAPRQAQYWEPNGINSFFNPDIKEAAEKLRYCIDNFEVVKKEKLSFITPEVIEGFGWNKQILILEGLIGKNE